MDGRITKSIVAISITALVGGSYRLISYYKGNTKSDLSVIPSFNFSEEDIAKSHLSNSLGGAEESLLEGPDAVQPNELASEMSQQNSKPEASSITKGNFDSTNSVSSLKSRKTAQESPPERKTS